MFLTFSCQVSKYKRPPAKTLRVHKITIATFYTENYSKFADIAIKINKIYAKKHNYNFTASKTVLVSTKKHTLHWNKYPYMKDVMQNSESDFFVWIDADAVFLNHDIRIEDYIELYKKDLIVSDDMWQNHPNNMNTGVLIIKKKTHGLSIFLTLCLKPKVVRNSINKNFMIRVV